MSSKTFSAGTLSRLFAALVGLIVLAGCGGGSSSTPTPTGTPAVTLSVTSLTFSSAVNTTSAAQSVTVTDSGTATVIFSGFSPAANGSPFASTNTCGTSLGEGGTCTISVTFTPTAAGTVSGTLTITDNASPSTQTVSLSGTGAVPTVSVSPPSLTFGSQGVGTSSAPQSVTVTNTGTVAVTIPQPVVSGDFSVTGSACNTVSPNNTCIFDVTFTPTAVGTRNGTLTFTDSASNSPQTVGLTGTGAAASGVSLTSSGVAITSLTFTGVTLGSTSAAQVVTLTNSGTAALTLSSITASQYFAETNTCPISPSTLAPAGTCTISVTFAPTVGGTLTGTLTLIDNAGTQTLALTGSGLSNFVPVSVVFGPYGNLGPPSSASGGSVYGSNYDVLFTTVTVCTPGTTNCVTIPYIQVDTGSIGLHVFASQLGGVTLPSITNTTEGITGTLYECNEYVDSYTWGPVQMATVQIGGETASQVPGGTANSGIPIQVIPDGGAAPLEFPCVTAELTNTNTPTIFGANGIVGLDVFAQDCGPTCESVNDYNFYGLYSGGQYYSGPAVPLAQQVWNPVAAFSSSDTNGVVLTFPPLFTPPNPDVGAATATGTLTFGINTQSNNQIPGTANVFQLDEYGYFGSATFNGVIFCSSGAATCPTSEASYGTFLDTGSYIYVVSDDATLSTGLDTSVSDCMVGSTDIGYFCSTLSIPLVVAGTNGTSTTVTLPVANALNLFDPNPSFAAFDNLGGPSCTPATGSPCNASTDAWDLGLAFFFGKTIYIGMQGTTVGGVTSANGYYAF
jgi:hypothetical protein